MNRNTRTFLVLAIALFAAGAASLGAYRVIQRMPVREVSVAHQFAVVAARALPAGTLVTKQDVKLVAWPSSAPLPGGFSKIEEVVERGVIDSLAENEPLTSGKLAAVGAGAGLSPTIAQGMRAISVKVNEVIGVAGFALPGSRVDVLVTVRKDNGEPMSRVVVSNVEVLTAGTNYDQEEARKEGKAMRSSVVTLSVTPEDSERIALAASEGKIILSLRNPLDREPTATAGVRMGGLMGTTVTTSVEPAPRPRPAPVATPAASPAPASAIYTVEAIRAAKRTEEQVR